MRPYRACIAVPFIGVSLGVAGLISGSGFLLGMGFTLTLLLLAISTLVAESIYYDLHPEKEQPEGNPWP